MNGNRFLKLIEDSLRENWDRSALTEYQGRTIRYRDLARLIERFHLWMESAGIEEGDKVAILGRNSINWVVAFLGTLSYGAVAVPLLHDFRPDSVHHLVNHSEAKALFASKNNWAGLDASKMPGIKISALLEDFSLLLPKDGKTTTWDDTDRLFRRKYLNFGPQDIHYHVEMPEELAILNYTSGTTGFSKGVMLPYRSLWSNTRFAIDNLYFLTTSAPVICMLPMAHMYGLEFEVLTGICKGCHVHILTRIISPQLILKAFHEIRPQLILAVPLLLEKIIKGKIQPILEEPVLKNLMRIPFIRGIILRKIREKLEIALGGEFNEIIIGGAALNRDVEDFLHKLRFRYTVGYGMTECGPLVSFAHWDSFKPGSVGRAVDRMEVKIQPGDGVNGEGEILVKGMNTMLGYYKNEEATKNMFTGDGWMRTGDIGVIDAENNIYIRGRCKTMILGANGQNIYPEEIECGLNELPYIKESVVVMRGNKLVALIYPDSQEMKQNNVSLKRLPALLKEDLDKLNAIMPKYCKLSFFEIQEAPFEKTPKLSIKRHLYK